MIKKLVVLNGTEGHKFEVGKQYANGDDVQMVDEIELLDDVYNVLLENNSRIEVVTKNVMVFYC